jgi:hypothetical protein
MNPAAIRERLREVERLRRHGPEAVARRLREASQLRDLCLRLERAMSAASENGRRAP